VACKKKHFSNIIERYLYNVLGGVGDVAFARATRFIIYILLSWVRVSLSYVYHW